PRRSEGAITCDPRRLSSAALQLAYTHSQRLNIARRTDRFSATPLTAAPASSGGLLAPRPAPLREAPGQATSAYALLAFDAVHPHLPAGRDRDHEPLLRRALLSNPEPGF